MKGYALYDIKHKHAIIVHDYGMALDMSRTPYYIGMVGGENTTLDSLLYHCNRLENNNKGVTQRDKTGRIIL